MEQSDVPPELERLPSHEYIEQINQAEQRSDTMALTTPIVAGVLLAAALFLWWKRRHARS